MVTVSAIGKIPKEIMSRVVAVVMFGSPPCPATVQDRCHSYCNKGDFVCDRENSGKGGKGKEGMAPPKADQLTPTRRSVLEIMADMEAEGMQPGPKADCSTYGAGAKIEVTGHQAVKGGNAHLAYNGDGHYVWAAACYAAEQYQKSAGK
jgi:hypothetical protein